jgi:hypothetical protein
LPNSGFKSTIVWYKLRNITISTIHPSFIIKHILPEEKIPVISFTFDIPDDKTIDKFRNAGTFLIGSATSVEEAILLEQKGID